MTLSSRFLAVANWLHRANAAFCAVLLAVLFAAQILIVILRYAFGIGFLELQDLVTYSFAVLVVMSVPVALRLDAHVRVDVLRGRQQPRTRRLLDGLGVLLLLVPVFGLTLWLVMPQILYSWSIREGGVETGGLPGYFVVKTALPIACALMIVQGLALLVDRQPRGDGEPGHGDGV